MLSYTFQALLKEELQLAGHLVFTVKADAPLLMTCQQASVHLDLLPRIQSS